MLEEQQEQQRVRRPWKKKTMRRRTNKTMMMMMMKKMMMTTTTTTTTMMKITTKTFRKTEPPRLTIPKPHPSRARIRPSLARITVLKVHDRPPLKIVVHSRYPLRWCHPPTMLVPVVIIIIIIAVVEEEEEERKEHHDDDGAEEERCARIPPCYRLKRPVMLRAEILPSFRPPRVDPKPAASVVRAPATVVPAPPPAARDCRSGRSRHRRKVSCK